MSNLKQAKKTPDKEKFEERLKVFANLIVDRLIEEKNKGELGVKGVKG
jgi:hypothetical protein